MVSAVRRFSTHLGGAGLVLYAPQGIHGSFSFKLEFPYSNNIAKYETLIIELISTLKMGIGRLYLQGFLGSSSSKLMGILYLGKFL